MRACPAGSPVKAHAPALATGFQHPALAVAPSGHRRDDLLKLKASPVEGTMAMPSCSNWQTLTRMPADRKDGRRILLWAHGDPVVGRWDTAREGWEDPESLHLVEAPAFWADISPPR